MVSRRIVVYSRLPSCHGPINHRLFRFETDLFLELYEFDTPSHPFRSILDLSDFIAETFSIMFLSDYHNHISVIHRQLILKWYPGGSLDGIIEWIIL